MLASLDYVSASIHTGFRQAREVMTARMLRAISNPLVNTLNHPHGRIIRRREGYEVDMQAVIERAAARRLRARAERHPRSARPERHLGAARA